MGSLERLVLDLKGFEGRKEVVKQLRTEIRKAIPPVRKAIKQRALDTLPEGGGLNAWVAKTRVSAAMKFVGRNAGVRLKGTKKSAKNKSDLRRIDAGKVRAPTFGRRGKGDWHSQTVPAGYFTAPAADVDRWRRVVEQAVDNAVQTIARG